MIEAAQLSLWFEDCRPAMHSSVQSQYQGEASLARGAVDQVEDVLGENALVPG